MSGWTEEQKQMVKDCECERRFARLNDWQRGFVKALSRAVAGGGNIAPSPPTIKALDEAWEKATAGG